MTEEKRAFFHTGKKFQQEPYHYRECGLDDIYLLNGFQMKKTAHGAGVTISAVDDLHRTIGLSLVSGRKVLSPRELRFLRREIDMTQAELGSKIGQSSQQVARWEKGESEIPGPAERLIRFLYVLYLLPARQRSSLLVRLVEKLDELTKQDETASKPLAFRSTDKGWEPQELPLAA